MQDQGHDRRRPRKRWGLSNALFLVAVVLVVYFQPFAHLFAGLAAYERIHGEWLEVAILAAAWALAQTIYLFGFRRDQRRAEMAALREDILSGRMKRLSLLPRGALLIGTLALVSLGVYAPEPYGWQILSVAAPLFLLLAAAELGRILHPGDSVLPDPHDELLMFFRGRMLTAGYVTAILALAGIYIVSLFSVRYIAYLLPAGITLSLLVPAWLYYRLDRRAGE